jgi:hypothetical protein
LFEHWSKKIVQAARPLPGMYKVEIWMGTEMLKVSESKTTTDT